MATGAPGSNGVWVYGEDDSEATFSALLNKAASTTNTQLGLDRARLDTLELPGRIVQVKEAQTATTVNVSTSTYTPTGLSVSITPKYSDSKIVVLVDQLLEQVSLTNIFEGNIRIYKDTLNLGTQALAIQAGLGAGGTLSYKSIISTSLTHSPATLSSVTYSTQINVTNGTRITAQPNSLRSNILAIEVKV